MKILSRISIASGSVFLIIISWIAALTLKIDIEDETEIQKRLITRADEYLADEIYILAVPLLEEAIEYQNEYTFKTENKLKELYLKFINKQDFRKKYTALLEKQMTREDPPADIFIEAADYYIKHSKLIEACDILEAGIEKTGNINILKLYESIRYAYKFEKNNYEDVTDIFGDTIGVKNKGLWGLANSNGNIIVPCQYDKISTFNSGRAIVKKDGIIFAVDAQNNRVALLKHEENEEIYDFGNLSEEFSSVLTKKGWKRVNINLEMGTMAFDEIGLYSNSYAAAKQNGKWGIINPDSNWLVPAEYDGVITDESGRAYMQNRFFLKKDGSVYLFDKNGRIGEAYEDARPFCSGKYAAVKKSGKWGFINTSGELIIPYQFNNALSFGQHLAAVKKGELWGYINIYGNIVIEPIFLQAKSFANNSAPVLTENGWDFISLIVKQNS